MNEIKERTAFAEDEIPIKKGGLKIDNSKSSIKSEKPMMEDFRNNINNILEKEEEQKKIAFELFSRFQSALRDKTLDSLKDVKLREKEKQIIKDLIDFSRIINSDENQEEDLGSISLFITLYRSMLIQRDRINELEFLQTKMSKDFILLESRLKALENK